MAGASVAVLTIMMLLIYLAAFVASIAMYILNGIGLMKMARSCGLPHPWLGFIPYANLYLMGQLAEQNPAPGKKSWPWRHIALVGQIVIVAISLALVGWMVVDMFSTIATGAEFSEYDLLALYGSMFGAMLPLSLLSTAYSIVLYIIYWKIYSLFAPDLAVIFLVLTILLGITPILIFILRNRTPVNRPGPSGDQWV